MNQLELPLSCTCAAGGPGCAFCDAVIDARAKAWRRLNEHLGRLRAYTAGPAPVRSFELRRGDARFVAISARGGPLELYAKGPGGAETFVGYARDVVAAGAEPFPCNVSYARKVG